MKVYDNGIYRDMTPEEEAEYKKLNEVFSQNTQPSEAERIAELETRLSRYEANEQATNILLGVTE